MSFTLPNVFAGDYRRLIIVPLALILISLFFIPSIRLGVDFKSGVLASAQVPTSVNPDSVKAQMEVKGYEDVQVRYYQGALGKNVIEVEFAESARMQKITDLQDAFSGQYDALTTMQLNLLNQNKSLESDQGYLQAVASLQSQADRLFVEAGHSLNASAYSNPNLLTREVSATVTVANSRYEQAIKNDLSSVVGTPDLSINRVSANLSSRFLEQVVWVVVFSAILAAIVIFFVFRDATPSLLVMVGAASDVVIALGAMGLFGIPFTLPSFAALLMLIGFSLDTDVLLTMRVLKIGEGSARDRVYDAMKTGITMSTTAMLAFIALFVLSTLTHISTYYEISAVALAGLVGDVFATWGINAVLLLHHMDDLEKKKSLGMGARR